LRDEVKPDEVDAGAPIADAGEPAVVGDAEVDASVPEAAAPITSASSSAGAPSASSSAAPAKPKPSSRVVAQGIVNRRCAPCHTARSRGGLRLADVTRPTKSGVLVPGDPQASSLYTRLTLPLDDDDHMPPADEAQPTKAEIAAIRAFIAELKP
jgi:uncharacterized membrane protein